MKQILFVVTISLVFTACTSSAIKSPNEAYAQSDLYQGYPCSPNCEAFAKGFDTAKDQEVTDPNMCQGDSMAEVTGCKAYVTEYQFENQTFNELINNL